MGNDVSGTTPAGISQDSLASAGRPVGAWVPWLDAETAAAVEDIVLSVTRKHAEVRAVILFGSVARGEQRSLDDPKPSDVDLLLILDPAVLDPAAERLTHERELALQDTIGEADYRNRHAPRAINTMFMYRDLAGWDALFMENVARDGLLLWACDPLPAPLAQIEKRGIAHAL